MRRMVVLCALVLVAGCVSEQTYKQEVHQVTRLTAQNKAYHELNQQLEAEVKANRLDARPDGWRVLWRDESVCLVCGQPCKRAALPQDGEVVYVGDGYSDRCASLAADRVFATRGLARYLDAEGATYEPFDDFLDVRDSLAG